MSMTVLTRPKKEQRVPAPELRGAALALGACTDKEVCLDGPAGTGKTVGALFKIHTFLSRYPGARALVARKTNIALSGSAMVTYRDNILRDRSDIRWFGGNRVEPAAYRYPNGSEMIVNGLDKPEKVMSSEFDMAFINEALECMPKDIEFVRIRLRPRTNGPRVPYRQLIMDVNPGAPIHWLNQRMIKGITTRLLSKHEDNPRYYDVVKQDWTDEGREYIFGNLEGLTGIWYLRFRKGLWCAASGIVFPEWNPAYHIVSREQLFKWEWLSSNGTLNRQVIKHMIGGADWGFVNPGVLKIYGVDHDNRLICLKEIYRTHKTIDWWIAQGQALEREYKVEKWLADPSRPDYVQQFNEAGLVCEGAKNTISLGLSFLRKRLAATNEARPRYGIYEYANTDPDEALREAHKPTGFTQEIEEYVWAEPKDGRPLKEEPVDEHNHSIDVSRYVCAELDAGNDLDELDRETAQAITQFRGL